MGHKLDREPVIEGFGLLWCVYETHAYIYTTNHSLQSVVLGPALGQSVSDA